MHSRIELALVERIDHRNPSVAIVAPGSTRQRTRYLRDALTRRARAIRRPDADALAAPVV